RYSRLSPPTILKHSRKLLKKHSHKNSPYGEFFKADKTYHVPEALFQFQYGRESSGTKRAKTSARRARRIPFSAEEVPALRKKEDSRRPYGLSIPRSFVYEHVPELLPL